MLGGLTAPPVSSGSSIAHDVDDAAKPRTRLKEKKERSDREGMPDATTVKDSLPPLGPGGWYADRARSRLRTLVSRSSARTPRSSGRGSVCIWFHEAREAGLIPLGAM